MATQVNTKELDVFVKDLRLSSIKVTKESASVFKSFVGDLFEKIKRRSPVDSGEYKDSWDLQTKGPLSFRITNDSDHQEVMEEGSEIGKLPWPSVPDEYPGTVVKNGRIWSNQRPEPVAGMAVETAPWDKLYDDLVKVIKARVG